jgi:hypothetical protein
MSYLRYLCLFVGGHMSYLRYLCLFAHCVVTCFVFLRLVYLLLPVSPNYSFFIALSVFSNIYST